MSRINVLLLLFMSSLMLTSMMRAKKPIPIVINDDIPDLEDDLSMEEQEILDTIEIEDPSIFMQWINRLGSSVIARCTLIKRAIERKYYRVKNWWYERKTEKNVNPHQATE